MDIILLELAGPDDREERMKKSNLFQAIIGALILATFSAAPLFAADFEVTKVVEIGPADLVPFLGPLKWSPDGTMISYFSKGYLMISDTLGNTHQVRKVESMPRVYEWVSDSLICIDSQTDFRRAGEISDKVMINVYDGTERTAQDFFQELVSDEASDIVDFDSPRRTVEGNLCFRTYTRSGRAKYLTYKPSRRKAVVSTQASDHYPRWGTDALYLVRVDGSDSVRFARKPYEHMPRSPVVSKDLRYVLMGGTLQRLSDSIYIVLDTMIKELPARTEVCGFVLGSFNESVSEILLQLSCDDGHMYVVNSIGVFNLLSNKLTIIDPIISKSNCTSPRYSPDGRKIAFLSEGKLFILERRGL